MIKKIKIEIQEEKHKRTYKHVTEVKAGALAQEKMRDLADSILNVLMEYGLLQEQGGSEE